MINLINILLTNKEFLAIVVAIIPAWNFFYAKKKEQQQIEFQNFHEKVLKKLANLGGKEALDSQIAIVFEMRSYSRYYPVSIRILKRLFKEWNAKSNTNPSLLKEIQLTISFMERNIFIKIFDYIKNNQY